MAIPIAIAPDDLADFLGRVAMGNLRRAAFDELRVSAQLRHTCFEAHARARAGEEEHQRQHFVAQQGVRFTNSAFALEIKGDLKKSY